MAARPPEVILDLDPERTEDPSEVLDFSKVATEDYRPKEGRPRLTYEQQRVLDYLHDSGANVVVNGCIGAGKTELCTRVCEDQVEQGRSFLYLVRTNIAKKSARKRLEEYEEYVRTIHSFAYELATAHLGHRPPMEGQDPFSKMLYWATLEACNHPDSYAVDFLVVDEAQVIDPQLLGLIMAIPHKTFLGVGDPRQSCYMDEWARSAFSSAGLGPKIFPILREELNCREFPLQDNWRSGPEVVETLEKFMPLGGSMIPLGPAPTSQRETWGVVTRTHKMLREVRRLLDSADISYQVKNQEGWKTMTHATPLATQVMVAHSCPGASFKNVIIVDWLSHSQEDNFLFYTSVGRATSKVYISGTSSFSRHIDRANHVPFASIPYIIRKSLP